MRIAANIASCRSCWAAHDTKQQLADSTAPASFKQNCANRAVSPMTAAPERVVKESDRAPDRFLVPHPLHSFCQSRGTLGSFRKDAGPNLFSVAVFASAPQDPRRSRR